MKEDRNDLNILTGKSSAKRSVDRPYCRWEENVRMDLKEKHSVRNCVNSAQFRDY